MSIGEIVMLGSEDVRSILQEVIKGIDLSALGDDENFYEFGIDSLDHSMVLLAIEEKSNIKIPDEAIESCSSVTGIVAYLSDNSK
jgi:acyl carrier protein